MALSEWFDFAKGNALTLAEGENIWQQGRIVFCQRVEDNAFHLTIRKFCDAQTSSNVNGAYGSRPESRNRNVLLASVQSGRRTLDHRSIHRRAVKVDRLLRRRWEESLKAQISGGKAAACVATRWGQRVPPCSASECHPKILAVIYRGFPERLHHIVPHWVEPGALFHSRIRLEREKKQRALTDPALAQTILNSAKFYEMEMRWHITLFLLIPDHLHAVLSFPRDKAMSDVIREWKRFHRRANNVMGQEGFLTIAYVLTNGACSLQQN